MTSYAIWGSGQKICRHVGTEVAAAASAGDTFRGQLFDPIGGPKSERHIQAFRFFGGVPRRITYDNLKTAVFRVLEGHNRQEQNTFTAFRSYYLFESHYCTPAQGHEKGGVENDVGYAQRNFFAPIPKAKDFATLNTALHQACLNDMQRRVRGEIHLVAEVWQAEKSALLPINPVDYPACTSHVVKVNQYSVV